MLRAVKGSKGSQLLQEDQNIGSSWRLKIQIKKLRN